MLLNSVVSGRISTRPSPEAVAFYRAIGYEELGREKHPSWELIFFTKELVASRDPA